MNTSTSAREKVCDQPIHPGAYVDRRRIRIVNLARKASSSVDPRASETTAKDLAIHDSCCPNKRHAVRQEYSTSNDVDPLYFDKSEKNSVHPTKTVDDKGKQVRGSTEGISYRQPNY